jgi:3-oxoacyl-[acyl-carrier protein] reductase
LSRVAIVTGVSRRQGIGFAVARRLLADGARVLIHSWSAHDAEQPWGADAAGVEALLEELGASGARLAHVEADLADPAAPALVVEHAVTAFGGVDVLVANHARSSAMTLETVTADELDRSWAVNARAVILLVQAYAARRDHARGDGRIVLFTSGQHLAPMADELPYAVTKGAVHQMTPSLADALAERGVTVNAINPGPVDTGWASDALRERVALQFPLGRWGRPDDIAAVVAWLASPESGQVTGQVIDAEAGFRRHGPADSAG